ncbi:unnamed protein product, partial [Ascophyllum nodosum]
REHNICCDTIAPSLGYEGDEGIYQACRGWTIAVFEHITSNDFIVRLTGMYILEYSPIVVDDLVSSSYATSSTTESDSTSGTLTSDSTEASTTTLIGDTSPTYTYGTTSDSPISTSSDPTTTDTRARDLSSTTTSATTNTREDPSTTTSSRDRRPRRLIEYNGDFNPGADVLATTVGVAAFYAAIPPTVRIMDEDYVPADEDGIELTEAAEDIAGLFERNSVGSIIRGAVFSSSLAVDTHFSSAVSTTSPLFKLPVDAIQRGR